MTPAAQAITSWAPKFLRWLTPRRLRAQAIVLAVCLWGVCAADFATGSLFDRAGNIKFQDFLPFYISAKLVAEHRANDIYTPSVQQQTLQSMMGAMHVQVPYLYGPQIALFFLPFVNLSFQAAAGIWATTSLLIYFACIYAVLRCSRNLSKFDVGFVAIAAAAFPPLFHVFVRGQISALILACFTTAFLALNAKREWLAGLALGLLIFKPQFLLGLPLIFVLAASWRALLALLFSAGAQLTFARLYFGSRLMQSYFDLLLHPSRWVNVAELSLAPIQMHSLRSFWTLLIPWPTAVLVLYALSSIAAIVIAARVWRSGSPFALRFSALTLAAVLVNPHLFVYDLLVLAPVLLLTVDWCTANRDAPLTPSLLVLSYLSFILPLFGPLSRWTHIQLSVLAFAALLWKLFCFTTQDHELAWTETPVV